DAPQLPGAVALDGGQVPPAGRVEGVAERVGPVRAVGEGNAVGDGAVREQAAQVAAGRRLELVDLGPGGGIDDVVEAALLPRADDQPAAELVDLGRVAEVEVWRVVRVVRVGEGVDEVPGVVAGLLVDPLDVAVGR